MDNGWEDVREIVGLVSPFYNNREHHFTSRLSSSHMGSIKSMQMDLPLSLVRYNMCTFSSLFLFCWITSQYNFSTTWRCKYEILTGTHAKTSKWSPGLIVMLKELTSVFSERGKQDLSIDTNISPRLARMIFMFLSIVHASIEQMQK
jgi:hypothetical protein